MMVYAKVKHSPSKKKTHKITVKELRERNARSKASYSPKPLQAPRGPQTLI